MSKKLNILCLGGFNYPLGMAGTQRVQFFIDRFIEKGSNIEVMTIGNLDDAKSGNKSNGIKDGIKYYNFGASLPKSYISYLAYPFLILMAFVRIFLFKNKDSKNILYVYNSVSIDVFSILLFARLIGFKVLVDIVEDYRIIKENQSALLNFKQNSINFFEERIHFFCDHVIVISNYLEELFTKKIRTKVPVDLIPISINFKVKTNAKENFNSPVRITYAGSFGNKDGLQYLISAFQDFSKLNPNSELILAGAGNNPEKIIKDTGNEKIKYAGCFFGEEYQTFLSDADVLCMTRLNTQYANAGFPFKVGEYLATGNPVIVTNVSDVSFYLEDNVDAKIVEPENSDALLKALISITGNFQKAKVMGQNGREKFLKYFNYTGNGDKLLNIMQNL